MIRDADLTGEVMVKTISDIFANEENYQKNVRK